MGDGRGEPKGIKVGLFKLIFQSIPSFRNKKISLFLMGKGDGRGDPVGAKPKLETLDFFKH